MITSPFTFSPLLILNNEHPITPPPNLVQEWYHEADNQLAPYYVYMAHQAARWGADTELLACGNYLKHCAAWEEEDVTEFYNYRRPRPPSLKERALKILEEEPEPDDMKELIVFDTAQVEIIRRALEQFDD